MDREAVRDCQFKAVCEAYNDPLIDGARKGGAGMGCQGQNDLYRSRHCRTFA